MTKKYPLLRATTGFTITEMMIAVVIFSIVLAAVYSTYQSQQKSYVTQDQVAEAQQNLRAAMFFVGSDLKMAGYDPQEVTDATILTADIAEMQFQVDEDGDGNFTNETPPPANDSNELVRYALSNDADRDGIADGFPCNLGREYWTGGLQPIAENIEALEFLYTLAPSAPAPLTRTSVATQSDRDLIRAIDVSLLVRTENPSDKYTDTQSYTTASGAVWGPFNDHFRRRLLITRIKCRNMGLYFN
jgi:type IV pilus assembly protein PilW